MSKKGRGAKKGSRRKPRRSSSLGDHHRHRKTLTPPLLNIGPNMVAFDWRLRQPDMLLMASLLENYPGDWRVVDALEALDDFVPKDEQRIIDGRLTRFEIIPERLRPEARRAVMERDPAILPDELGHALALFDDCPGRWIYEDWVSEHEHDSELGVQYLRKLLAQLHDGRGEFAVHARMLSLGRYLAHERIFFSHEVSSFELLGRYPNGCTPDEQRQARQAAKLMYDMVIQTHGDTSEDGEARRAEEWGHSFWIQCAALAKTSKDEEKGS